MVKDEREKERKEVDREDLDGIFCFRTGSFHLNIKEII